MLPKLVAKDMRRALEGGIDVAVADLEARQHVRLHAAAHHGRTGRHRLAAIGVRRERLVIDLDERRRVLGDVAALGHDHRHRLADESDFLAGEDQRACCLRAAASRARRAASAAA